MMTIDRLEELHTLTRQFAKTAVDAGYGSTAVEFAADIRSLIDAEIERQSVENRDTEIGVAIGTVTRMGEWFKAMGGHKDEIMLEYLERNIPLIVDALRAYRKPERMTDELRAGLEQAYRLLEHDLDDNYYDADHTKAVSMAMKYIESVLQMGRKPEPCEWCEKFRQKEVQS